MAVRRGRETAADMVRSLGLVLAIVLVIVFFAHPRSKDEQGVRVIDPSNQLRQFSAQAPTVPVPGALPGWRSTVADYDSRTSTLRLGWVTPKSEYAEYAASTAPPEGFVQEFTGADTAAGSVEIDGVRWAEYRDDDAISLVRTVGGATLVLGTKRDSASLEELRVLAGSLAT